jgi:serine/threonine-protein kinase RsbW
MNHVDPDNEKTFKTATFPADLREARVVADGIIQDIERADYTVGAMFAIKLALEEALTNAIKHGDRNDADKQVTVRYAVSPAKCVIIIRDQGQGFNPDAVPDCTRTDRLALPNGRGIMLMRAYMDEVAYRCRGTEIYLMKRNE